MGKPTSGDIAAWKEQYGDVYSVDIRDQTFVFRALSFKELKYLSSSSTSASYVDLEDYCIQRGLLFPSTEEAEDLPAGAYSSLADSIRDASGLGDARTAIASLEQAREDAFNVINVAKVYILTTMPSYKEEDIDDYTATQLFHKVALAERIIELQQQILSGNQLTFTIIDPEEEAQRAAEEERKQQERMERFVKSGGHYDKNAAPPVKPRLKTDDPIAAKLRGRR
jgi:hypothetical protein